MAKDLWPQAAAAGVYSIKDRRKRGEEARTLFQGMFLSAEKKQIDLGDDHLISEAILMNFAGKNSPVLLIPTIVAKWRLTGLKPGTDTTAATLAFSIHNLIRRPELYRKLQAELLGMQKANGGARLTCMQLEGNELLDACVKEALRITCPVSGRLPRKVPAEGWNYQGYYIPPGVSNHQSSLFCLLIWKTRALSLPLHTLNVTTRRCFPTPKNIDLRDG